MESVTIKVGEVSITAALAAVNPRLEISGLRENPTRETRVRVQAALDTCGVRIDRGVRLTFAPEVTARGTARYDAAVAVAVACVLRGVEPPKATPIAELALDGALRPVVGVARAALATEGAVVVAPSQGEIAARVLGVRAHTAAHLRDVLDGAIDPVEWVLSGRPIDAPALADLRGPAAELALRVVNAIAAGHRKILIVGPGGCGATMVARRMPAFLPPVGGELETLLTYDDCGLPPPASPDGLLVGRPFRAPHHTASAAALRGSGGIPGEIHLAAHGVLFLDEVTDFRLDALEEALRAPGVVIAAARPEELARERTRARRAVMDRFEITIEVQP